MPIITPSELPANARLTRAGISVIPEHEALHQDIAPLQVAILNLMPDKREAEYQLARMIGSTSLQVQLTLLRTASYESKNTSSEHLQKFYAQWDDVSSRRFDGLIMTGAPIEKRAFEHVDYWKELQDIMNWSRENVQNRLSICWGAQAGLHHFYGIDKHMLPKKASGIFTHRANTLDHPLTRGFDDHFPVPVSRHTEVRKADIEEINELRILAESPQTGVYIVQSTNDQETYVMNHPEYDTWTLNEEYKRDVARYEDDTRKGVENPEPAVMPRNYYPFSDPNRCPENTWRSHGQTLYRNWVDWVYARKSLRHLKTDASADHYKI